MSQILTHNEHEKYCSENSLPRVVSLVSLVSSGKLRCFGLVYIVLLRSHLAVSDINAAWKWKRGENPGRIHFLREGACLRRRKLRFQGLRGRILNPKSSGSIFVDEKSCFKMPTVVLAKGTVARIDPLDCFQFVGFLGRTSDLFKITAERYTHLKENALEIPLFSNFSWRESNFKLKWLPTHESYLFLYFSSPQDVASSHFSLHYGRRREVED